MCLASITAAFAGARQTLYGVCFGKTPSDSKLLRWLVQYRRIFTKKSAPQQVYMLNLNGDVLVRN